MNKQTEAPYFVVNQHGLSTSSAFNSLDAARLHAKRLAEKHCGVSFYVTRVVQAYVVPKPDVVVINYD